MELLMIGSDMGHMHDKARVKPNLCGLLLLSNVIYLGG